MNTDGKSLIRNSIYNVLYKVLNVLFPLIMSAYASHIIMAKGIGKVASAQNIVQYFVLVAALGIPEYGIREMAIRRENNSEKNKLFSELFVMNFISTICCTVMYILLAEQMHWFNDKILYIIMGGVIILNIFNVDWIYQGEENYKYIVVRNFFVKVISLILLFLLVRKKEHYYYYALVNVIAIAGNYLFNIFYLKRIGIKLSIRNIGILRHLKPVVILLCTTLSIELYTLLDTTMLTFFCSEEEVGYYTIALKIPRMVIVTVTGLSGVLLPRLSRYYHEGSFEKCNSVINKMISLLIFIFLPCGVGLILTAPELIIVLFGKTFVPGVMTLRIASLLVYALGFSNLFGTQLLLTAGCEKKLLICTIVGAITNIILNLFLIPKFQQDGATVASIISEVLVTFMAYFFSKKYFSISFDKKIFAISLFSCILMTIICMMVKYLVHSSIWSLVIALLMGGISYAVLNFLLKNPLFKLLKNCYK